MSDRADDRPLPPDGYDPRYNPVAFYIQLLAAHDQGAMTGRPLLTEAGVVQVQHFLELDRAGRYAAADGSPDNDTSTECPQWDGRALRLGNEVLKRFKQPAPYQTAILSEFELRGWPTTPIPIRLRLERGEDEREAHKRLHRTVNNLNRSLDPARIWFRVDWDTVWWERRSVADEQES